MKMLTPLSISLCLLGLVALPTFAATSDSQKIATLEKQVSVLQQQVSSISNNQNNSTAKPVSKKSSTSTSSAHDTTSLAAGNDAIEGPNDLPTTGPLYLPVDLDVPGQSFVSSGPYIGVPFEFAGGHLIVNTPSVNEDVLLLQVDKNVDTRLAALGRSMGKVLGSHILLSGMVEAQAMTRNGGGSTNSNDIDLTTVNFDAYVMGPSTWTSAFIEFSYDNNIGTQTGAFSSEDRVLNSRVFINKAFIVLGDFTKSPFYSSFGQMYLPFGTYSTTMVSSPLTKILARTLSRAFVIGYKQQSENSLLATAYIFKGASHPSSVSHVNNGGVNLSYAFKKNAVSGVVGAGVIGNMADSLGMQLTGNNTTDAVLFGGFGGPTEVVPIDGNPQDLQEINSGSEKLVHRVPAYDANIKLSFGQNIQFIGEYITASTDFNPADLQLNGHGARPQAMNVELVYNFGWTVDPTSIGFSYQMSKDALAIGLPAERYSVTINRSFWKNTLQSLEFRHDINYADGDTSGGSGRPGPTGNGDGANMITLQFDYYF